MSAVSGRICGICEQDAGRGWVGVEIGLYTAHGLVDDPEPLTLCERCQHKLTGVAAEATILDEDIQDAVRAAIGVDCRREAVD